jgi:arylamine N-acetyltransferase
MTNTAVRTWNPARTHATVTVTLDDGSTYTASGARAQRAAAALIVAHGNAPAKLQLRSDEDRAHAEAYRLLTRSTLTHAGHTFAVDPARLAICLPVEDR